MKINMLIENALRDNARYKGISCRDSDKVLTLYIWKQLGLELSLDQMEQFMDLPSTESIRRTRQKIQEQGRYTASKPVLNERQWKSLVMRQNAPQAKPERISTLIQERMF